MKPKYLPIEDRKNIKILKKTKDHQMIIDILNQFFIRPFTLQTLWEYRTWYYMLTKEELDLNPALKAGFIQIKIMNGELLEAIELINELEDGSVYKIYSSYVMPIDPKKFIETINSLNTTYVGPVPVMTVTAGRPSVLSGIWDFSSFSDKLVENPHYLDEPLKKMFGDKADLIADTLLIEVLYQRDQCYDALVKIVGLLPFLKDRKDMRLLFVTLTHEMFIMVLHNQVSSAAPIIDSIRKQIVGVGLEEYTPNIDALEAWAAMYEGDYKKVTQWLKEAAPDEYGRFCMLDMFRYLVKIRAYLIQDKHLAITYLATKLNALLDGGYRYKDICELQLLWAMSDYARKDKKSAFAHMDIALEIAMKYRLDRTIADEGKRAYELLIDYQKERGTNQYLDRIIELTKEIAISQPNYLKPQLPDKPSLTPAEMNVLRLLEAGHSNAEIAKLTGTGVDNIKFHLKKIYVKLNVSSRYQAIKSAIELGLIEPMD